MMTITAKRDDERVTLEELTDLHHDLKKIIERLWKIHETQYGTDGQYLDEKGGFTEAGKKRLYGMFAEAGHKNAELARFFGVTDAAIAYHRKAWLRRS